jgi:DNA modification methylase
MVAVFREVRRVLRDDGTLWLNLGDSYASSGGERAYGSSDHGTGRGPGTRRHDVPASGLKPKDLVGIPWRVAFALQSDGWYLRSDIIWSKPNPMPESVTDRPTKAHEYVFLLSKSARYFYDYEAALEDGEGYGSGNKTKRWGNNHTIERAEGAGAIERHLSIPWEGRSTRNRRTVWTIATSPYSEAHFATFPPALVEPCIKAGTSERGCCATCGAPWTRETEKSRTFESGSGKAGNMPIGKNGAGLQGGGETLDIRRGPTVHSTTTGWSPACRCDADTKPCTVLDPFSGAGTALLVADRLGRDGIGIDLNPEYVALARKRVCQDAPLFAQVDVMNEIERESSAIKCEREESSEHPSNR